MSSDHATQPTADEQPRVDWHRFWDERGDRDPWEWWGQTKLAALLGVHHDQVQSKEHAQEVLAKAAKTGVLEHQAGKGYRIEDPPADGMDETEAPEPAPEPAAKRQTAPDTQAEIAELRRENARLKQRLSAVEQAVGALVAPDKEGVPRDELSTHASRQARRITRTSQAVRKVSDQLDEIGDSAGSSWSTQERVHALRTHLVRKNEGDKTYAMDYNAIQSFFAGKEADVSPSWASRLLKRAAEGHEAFSVGKSPDGTQRLTVDRHEIADESFYRRKNSAGQEDG